MLKSTNEEEGEEIQEQYFELLIMICCARARSDLREKVQDSCAAGCQALKEAASNL